MVDRATRVGIGESLRYRLPHIDFICEIVPAGIGGELFDETERVGADIGGLTHSRNIVRKHGASKQADPARRGVNLLAKPSAVTP